MAAAGNDENRPPNVFKLNRDTFEPIFELLSWEDLISFSHSCKHLRNSVGEYFRFKFGSRDVICTEDGVCIKVDGLNTRINHLSAYIPRMTIWFGSLRKYDFVRNTNFESLQQLKLYYTSLDETIANTNIAHVVNNLELNECNCKNEFFETFLQLFTAVSRLSIERHSATNTVIGTDNQWMCRHYPTLEHLGLQLNRSTSMPELPLFIERNPNISSVTLNSGLFNANTNRFMQTNIHLDVLMIKIQNSKAPGGNDDINDMIDALRMLNMRQFYRTLVLIFEYVIIDRLLIQKMASLPGLTELMVNDACDVLDRIELIQQIPSLRKITFDFASREDVLPFVESNQNWNVRQNGKFGKVIQK